MKNLIKKFTLSISLITLIQMSINAQDQVDALRFSEIDWQGSARFMGAGRAFGAVGAEFSALSLNPASIGLYKKNEVTFTPITISGYKNTSNYNGTAMPGQNVRYNLNNVGMVFAIPGVSNSLWKKFQIGFGYNRINNYNTIFSIEGRSNGSTIGSAYADYAEGLDSRDIENKNIWSEEMQLAWYYYLIDPASGSYTSYIPALTGLDLLQTSTVRRTGGNDEMIFSFGTNYDDKLYLGATLGIPFINFTENRTYSEVNDKQKSDYKFQRWEIADKLSIRSTGINLKLGVVYQPLDFLRVGFAFHTPTYYGNVKDYSERNVLASKWDYIDTLWNTKSFKNDTYYPNSFRYALTTPLRAMVNVAFFIKQRAFISAEYEIADYGMANMYAIDYNFSEENKNIQKMYGACHIARIGAEINLNQVFAVRAGYNYISSPYKNDINDGSKHYGSLGFGFRSKHVYGDFAYALIVSKEKYWMYNPQYVNPVENRLITHRVVMTMGVKF